MCVLSASLAAVTVSELQLASALCKMASLLVPVCLSYKLQAPAAAVKCSSFWWFEPPDLSWRGVPLYRGGILNEWNFFPAHEVGEESCLCHLWAVALTISAIHEGPLFWFSQSSFISLLWCLAPPSFPGNNGVHGSAVSANTPSIMTLYRAVLSALTQHVMCWCYDGPFKHSQRPRLSSQHRLWVSSYAKYTTHTHT